MPAMSNQTPNLASRQIRPRSAPFAVVVGISDAQTLSVAAA